MKIKIVIFCLIFLSPVLLKSQSWRDIKSVEDVCKAYPQEMSKMLNELNLELPTMKEVKQAYENKDVTDACSKLLEYYKNGETAKYLRKAKPENTTKTIAKADTTLKNVFIIQNVRGVVPWGEDGHRDWYYKGPNEDREWAWLSNRHTQLSQVFDAYLETGNPKYAAYIDLFLRDFIIKSMPYPAVKGSGSIWRGLEVSFRAKVWSEIFYGMINNEYIAPATQLLMLSSLLDHAHYNRNFHAQANWLTMEISALATVATNFPEFKKSDEWLAYSIEAMVGSMRKQIYPDGVQTELTSHYHNVSLHNFDLFQKICERANKPLPDYYNRTLEDMYSYIAHAVRPDGNRILNNDGDRGSDRKLILAGAKTYNKPEWEYIATNGESGVKPKDGPSYLFPWAGQLISRSSFDSNAHWSFFDVGPWGSGHQHNDKLHISLSAYGRDLLVDAGRFAYTGEVAEKFRPYAKGTQGHNAILIDNKGQGPGPLLANEPLSETYFKITPQFDYAWSSMSNFIDLEDVIHKRALFYVRGGFWVVVDNIETNVPRKIETLWHFHPDCKVKKETEGIVTTNNIKGNLQVIPVQKTDWQVDFVKGQEEPEIQGWYSEEYNIYEPNTTAVYSTTINTDATFVWLLVPSEFESFVYKAEIISKNKDEIKLDISNSANEKWLLTIPFSNSENAQLFFNGK